MACKILFDLAVTRNRLAKAGFGILIPIMSCHRAEPTHILAAQVGEPDRHVSCDRQFGDVTDSGNLSAEEVCVDVPKVFLEIFQSLSLGHVVGKFLQVSQPHIAVLPVDIAD